MTKSKQKYYSGDRIRSLNADVNFIFGEKSNGKSYDVKHYVLKDYAETGKQFYLVRRNKLDVSTAKMALYLSDVDIKKIMPEYDVIYAHAGSIYVAKLDENGFRRQAQTVGFYSSLVDAQHISGMQYPNVRHFILEEFAAISDENYIPDELVFFNILLSNVIRRREDYKLWFLGNTLSRICPYFDEYGITRIVRKMEIGTIETVERETDAGPQLIAIEYCENAGGVTNLFGKKSGSMINSGRWHVDAQPRLPYPRSEWKTRYTVVVEYDEFKYLVEVLSRKREYVVYVSPKTKDIQPKTRVISNKFSSSRYYTGDFTPLCQSDKVLFDLITMGKCCYSDDLTGTEFSQIMKNF